MKNIPDKYWNAYRYELIWPLENKIITKRQEIQGKYFK
jgi:hypothetical protein